MQSRPTPVTESREGQSVQIEIFEQAEYARSVVKNSPDCVKLLDLDGKLVAMNTTGMCSMEIDDFGPFEGKQWHTLWPSVSQANVREALDAALAGKPGRFQGFCPTAKGTPRWWDVIVTPIREASGEINQILSVSRDITHFKEAEEKVRQSEAQLKALTQASPGLISIFRPDGTCEFRNDRWAEFSGLPNQRGIGLGGIDIVHPDDKDRVLDLWHQHLKSGEPYEAEVRLLRADGEYRWFLSRVIPTKDEAGKVIKWYGAGTDITLQKEMARQTADAIRLHANLLEEKVRQRTAELQRMVEELELVSYSLSHDLRQPLRAMQQFSQILIEDYSKEMGRDGQQYLQQIVRATTRMDRLIQDVLTYSQLSRRNLVLETVDLDVLVHDILSQYPLFKEPHAAVLPKGILLPVTGSISLLTQVISNLLGNAVKFIPTGTKPRVEISTEKQNQMVRLVIKDNGIGIKPENVDLIWRMFERLHVAKEYEGTGIGLSIVKKAVELMNGTAGVESDPGKGSAFWVDLPAAKNLIK